MKIHGHEFAVAEAPQDYWGWVAEGRYDFEWKVYDRWLKPEHTFLDLGAWVGAHSLYASQTAKAVIAVEPDPVALEILIQNLSGLEHRPTMRIIHDAVSDEAGEMTLGSGCLGASTTRKAYTKSLSSEDLVTFPSKKVTLRDVCPEGPLFIKMDIEGMEEEVLRDLEFFRERKPILYVELHPFWWEDVDKTRKDFEAVAALYSHVERVQSETVLLA